MKNTQTIGNVKVRAFLAAATLISGVCSAQPSFDFTGDGQWDYAQALVATEFEVPRYGRVYVWDGQTRELKGEFQSAELGDLYGWCVGSISDRNGDGIDELLVSAPLSNQAFIDAGSVYIIDPSTGQTLDRIDGEQIGEGLGRYVTSLGDFDGDGTDDLAVSG